jgi:hypothetical protein
MTLLRQLDTVYKDSANLDAFGKLRVSNPITIFDSKSLFSKRPLFWSEALTATGTSTYDADRATIVLEVPASGDKVIRQTKEFFNYQPGKSHLIYVSFNAYGHEVNSLKRIGTFYENDGIFFEDDGIDYKMVLRTSTSSAPTDTAIAQADWNIDAMNGTGISGVTIDFTKTQILIIDYEWLGVGRVRCGWIINGKTYYCHEFLNANNIVDVYMATPNLPIRYEIEATGTVVGTPKIDAICSTVIKEGNGTYPEGIIFSMSNNSTGLSVASSAQESLIQLRVRSDRIRKGILDVMNMSVLCTTNTNFMWSVRINPTVTGGSASWVNVGDDSVAEYDLSQNGNVSGGTIIASGYASNNIDQAQSSIQSAIHAAADITGVADIIVLSVLNLGTGEETFYGSLIWKELL